MTPEAPRLSAQTTASALHRTSLLVVGGSVAAVVGTILVVLGYAGWTGRARYEPAHLAEQAGAAAGSAQVVRDEAAR